jgi:GT2 family glycosyltransferase
VTSSAKISSPPVTLSVVIVNWKSKDYLRKCLKTLEPALSGVDSEIIVVDGGSFDGCGEMLAAEAPQVRFIQAKENLGFGRSNNLGVESAVGEILLLLNPDTEVHPDSIRTLLRAFGTLNNPGLLGACLLNTDGSLQTSCVQSFPTPLNQALDSEALRKKFPNSSLWGMTALANTKDPAVVEAVSGACMLLRADTFREVGGFTRQYFMYGEDLDLCRKVTNLGKKVYYVPDAKIVHHGGGSSRTQFSKFSNVLMRESVYRFIRIHSGVLSAFLYRLGLSISALVRISLLSPQALFLPDAQRARTSLKKWVALFRWALGLERWTRNYARTTVAK